MTATLINSIKLLQYILILANSDPNKTKAKPPAPFPIPDKPAAKEKKPDAPGSFAFIAKSRIAAMKKLKEAEGVI